MTEWRAAKGVASFVFALPFVAIDGRLSNVEATRYRWNTMWFLQHSSALFRRAKMLVGFSFGVFCEVGDWVRFTYTAESSSNEEPHKKNGSTRMVACIDI